MTLSETTLETKKVNLVRKWPEIKALEIKSEITTELYSQYKKMCYPQIRSWSPQGMRVLRPWTFPRAEVMFVTIQRENIRPSKKKWTRLLQCLNCLVFAVRLWIITSLYRLPIGSLQSTCMLCIPPALHWGPYTPQGSTHDLWTECY
jgi:hypothetical protein